jgi:hypothetical protein
LAGRFGASGPAPLYDATKEDVAWLAEVNADGRDACDALGTRQLERLFDSFEEASWHSGETPASAAHAYEILGYSSGASVAEAEAAVKAANAGMMMGLEGLERELIGFADEGDLLAPGTDANAADAAAWDLVRGAELETGSLPRARFPRRRRALGPLVHAPDDAERVVRARNGRARRDVLEGVRRRVGRVRAGVPPELRRGRRHRRGGRLRRRLGRAPRRRRLRRRVGKREEQ